MSSRNPTHAVWDPDNVVIVYGAGGERLAEEISGIIGLPSTSCITLRSPDGESHVRVGSNIRGRDVYVVQSTAAPVNTNFIELSLVISACKRANARRVTAIAPYLGYARQTRKAKSRVPISAADIATLLEECCLDTLVTIDTHDPQIAGFYSPCCAFDNLSYVPTAARFLAHKGFKAPVVVAPTASAVGSAMAFVEALREIAAAAKAAKDKAAGIAAAAAVAAAAAAANRASSSVGASASTSLNPSTTFMRPPRTNIGVPLDGEPAPADLSDPGAPSASGPASLSSASLAASLAASSCSSPLPLRVPHGTRGPSSLGQQQQQASLAMLLQVERRAKGSEARGIKELELTGDVAGRDCILIDDVRSPARARDAGSHPPRPAATRRDPPRPAATRRTHPCHSLTPFHCSSRPRRLSTPA